MFPTDTDLTQSKDITASITESIKTDTLGKSLKFDYTTNQFTFTDGKNDIPTDLQSITQWIELFIRTEKEKYQIYTDSFGLDLSDLIGYRLPRSFQVAEIKRRLTDGILQKCPKTKRVYDWAFDRGTFTFRVETELGEVTINV